MAKAQADADQIPVTKRSLFSWVWESSLKLQLLLLVVIVVTVFARIMPLEFQKKIINTAIGQRNLDLLLLYCGYYLLAVLTAGVLKYVINVIQTYLGQTTLANLRKKLYDHILKLPLGYFRKTQPGMVVSSLVTEIVPVGEFVGMALAVPLTNILTLLGFGIYLFYLNWQMALITMAIYPIVLLVIPRLQRKTNEVNKKRVDATREISSNIAESISGIHEIHGNGSYGVESRRFGTQCDTLERYRIVWTLYKTGVKAINNLLVNLTPFLLFLVGGYLIIQGRFDLGALVAFLSAQEKLFEPWKELMEFYQVYQDASVRYSRTMEYFDFPAEHVLVIAGRAPLQLEPRVEIEKVSFEVEGGIRLLHDINLTVEPGEQLALIGFSGSGKSTLALCIGQLYKYTSGSLRLGGQEVSALSKQDMTENMGFVSQSPFIFTGTIKENLLYSCEAALHGEPGVEGENLPSLDDQIAVLQQAGIFVDVLRFGLNAVIDETRDEQLAARIIRVRESFRRDYGEALSDMVEFYDEQRYLIHSSVAANLTFGSSRDPDWAMERLARNAAFTSVLDKTQTHGPLLALGAEMARTTVDILGNMPKDAMFFQQSPIPAEAIDDYKEIVRRLERDRLADLSAEDRAKLLEIALAFVPGRHKMVAMPQMLERMLLEARRAFRETIEAERPGVFTFYRVDEYLGAQTILDNILFGKVRSQNPQAQEKISQSIIQLLVEEDLLETIVAIGMRFQVGSKGDKLSGGQRQKLAIARCFLKQPRLMILDEATSALDNKSQARIQNILETRYRGRSTVIAVAHRLDIIVNYDKVAVMKAGKIVECGSYPELMAKKGSLYELVHGRK